MVMMRMVMTMMLMTMIYIDIHGEGDTNFQESNESGDAGAAGGLFKKNQLVGDDDDDFFRLEGNPVVGLRSWLPWHMLRRLSLFLANPLSLAIIDV